jgi:L-lactate dehydrogenase complex protein LldE
MFLGLEKEAMRIGLFATCLVDLMRPGDRVLGAEAAGIGRLRGHGARGADLLRTACLQLRRARVSRDLAEKFLREFEMFDYVVVPSGSCGGMIRQHYQDLLRDDPELHGRYERLRERVFELTDFLVNVAKIDRFDSTFAGHVTYHDSCSGLRELGVKQQPRELLGKLPGVTLTEMKDCEACCGFGGTFSVKYGNISTAIVDEKCANIKSSGADAVVLGDLGCILNIEGRLRRTGDTRTRVLHIAQVLAGDA